MTDLVLSGNRRASLTRGEQLLGSKRQRTCVGCRQSCAHTELVRVVASGDGNVVFDLVGAAWGRGAWVHPRTECLVKSVRGLGRALRQTLRVTPSGLHDGLVNAAWRRVGRLLAAAQRSGQLSVETESVERCWAERSIALILLADDAYAVATPPWVAEAGLQGRVLIGPSRAIIGEWLGAQEVNLAAITESRLAMAVARNVAIAVTPAPARASRGSDKGTEVG